MNIKELTDTFDQEGETELLDMLMMACDCDLLAELRTKIGSTEYPWSMVLDFVNDCRVTDLQYNKEITQHDIEQILANTTDEQFEQNLMLYKLKGE